LIDSTAGCFLPAAAARSVLPAFRALVLDAVPTDGIVHSVTTRVV